jgi:hypothetical protein
MKLSSLAALSDQTFSLEKAQEFFLHHMKQ